MTLRRIHVVSWRDLDDPEAGGSELHINRLAARWAANGLDVTIRTGAVAGGPAELTRDGYRVVRRGGRLTGLVRSPSSELAGRQGRRDGLVEVWHGINFLAPLWARGPLVGIAHHVHGEQFRHVLPPGAAQLASFFERRVSPVVYRSTPLVTLSRSTREGLIALGHRPGNVVVSSPGVADHFTPGGRRSTHPLVAVVGRLMPQKRVEDVIDALRPLAGRFPGLELVVVGDGPHRRVLEATAPAWVRFAGRVDDDELVATYRRAWVVASASIAEGWNMTITEAGACGTPAVATRIAGHVDAIVDGETGLLADDRAGLTHALARLLADEPTRRRLGEAARRHAAGFDWDEAADTVLGLLQAQAAPTPRRP